MVSHHHLGDVIAVQFDQDDDVAVFVPASADVLRCSSTAWEILSQTVVAADQQLEPLDHGVSRSSMVDPGALALMTALVRNGAKLSAA